MFNAFGVAFDLVHHDGDCSRKTWIFESTLGLFSGQSKGFES